MCRRRRDVSAVTAPSPAPRRRRCVNDAVAHRGALVDGDDDLPPKSGNPAGIADQPLRDDRLQLGPVVAQVGPNRTVPVDVAVARTLDAAGTSERPAGCL